MSEFPIVPWRGGGGAIFSHVFERGGGHIFSAY